MLHRTTVVITGAGVAAAVAIAGAVAAGSHSSHSATNRDATSAPAPATVATMSATVGGKAETILVDGHGMPLYYYTPDTATTSHVSGELAALWPPVTTSTVPTTTGLSGTLTVVRDSHGTQLAYNGHLLYTFVSDRRGVVTGQGVQDFFVVTPGLSATGGASAPGTTSGTGGSSRGY
jgi:predicted lipoprotein with Yx(FWY)xxD motif